MHRTLVPQGGHLARQTTREPQHGRVARHDLRNEPTHPAADRVVDVNEALAVGRGIDGLPRRSHAAPRRAPQAPGDVTEADEAASIGRRDLE